MEGSSLIPKNADDAQYLVSVQSIRSWEESFEKERWTEPKVNLFEDDDNFYIEAAMPGVSRENIKVRFEKGNLLIMGRINYEDAVRRKFILQESEVANYYRKFRLSDSVNPDTIEAGLNDGLLLVRMAKSDKIKPRTIEIK